MNHELVNSDDYAILQDKLEDRLRRYYKQISWCKGFPNNKCVETSRDVAKIFDLRYVRGVFTINVGDNFRYFDHAWNEDNNGVIVDFTASQFNRYLFDKVPKGVLIIYPNAEGYWRYDSLYVQESGLY